METQERCCNCCGCRRQCCCEYREDCARKMEQEARFDEREWLIVAFLIYAFLEYLFFQAAHRKCRRIDHFGDSGDLDRDLVADAVVSRSISPEQKIFFSKVKQ